MKISENKGDYFRLLSSIYHYLLEPENSFKYSCILYTRAMSGGGTATLNNNNFLISKFLVLSTLLAGQCPCLPWFKYAYDSK